MPRNSEYAQPGYEVPDSGTDAFVEAASDGRVYLTVADADGQGFQLPMGPREAEKLAANLVAKAKQARAYVGSN